MNRIATRRSFPRRALSAIWQAYEDNAWLPLATVVILLLIVNFPT